MSNEFGRFQIEKELGRGAFGRVYQAYDPLMQRQVAIKVLSPEADPEALRKFKAEAGTTASLNHKNVVRVYEFAEDRGRPYLVMELLRGETLRQLIDSGRPLSLLEKAGILYSVAEGLEYAHSHGVVHRDVKPLNIMVDAELEVKIMDFGTAAMFGSEGTRRSSRDHVLGTIAYMSPEWFSGAPVGRKADLFAFGVVCYEFLTGHHPFQAEDDTVTANRIGIHDPAPLSSIVEGCPERLERLIQSLLEKDPDMRCSSFEDVLLDLRPILEELKAKRAQELFEQIPAKLDDGDLTGAKEAVKLVLELFPEHAEGRALLEEIRRREQRRSIMARVHGMKTRAGQLMSEGDWTGAIDVLDAARELDESDSEVRDLLARAKAEQERVRKVARLLAEAQWEERAGNLEAGLEKANECLALDIANKEAADLARSLSERVEAIQSVRRAEEQRLRLAREAAERAEQAIKDDVREALERDDLDEAERRLGAARAQYGNREFWVSLDKEFKHRQRYLMALLMADMAVKSGESERAREILSPFANSAPDGRAEEILKSVDRPAGVIQKPAIRRDKNSRLPSKLAFWLPIVIAAVLGVVVAILLSQHGPEGKTAGKKSSGTQVQKAPAPTDGPPQISVPPPSVTTDKKEKGDLALDDQMLIRQAIAAYASAIAQKSEAKLRRAWPAIPEVDLRLWHDAFEKTETLNFSLQPASSAEISGNGASVQCRREVTKVYTDGRSPYSASGYVKVLLRRRGSGWIVSSVSAP